MRISMPFLIALILALIVILAILFFPSMAHGLNKAFENLGIKEENNTVSEINAVAMYKNFHNEYNLCKLNPDYDCMCSMTVFSLPKGNYIKLEGDGTKSYLSLHRSSDNKNVLEGTPMERLEVEDNLFIPLDEDLHYFDEHYSNWDMTNFKSLSGRSVKLIENNPGFFDGAHTSMLVKSSVGKDFSFKSIFKSTPEKSLVAYAPQGLIASEEQYMLNVFNSFRKCDNFGTEDLDQYKESVNLISQKYVDCKVLGDCGIFENKIPAGGAVYISNHPGKTVIGAIETKATSFDESVAFLLEDGSTDQDFCFKYKDGNWYWDTAFYFKRQWDVPLVTGGGDVCYPFLSSYSNVDSPRLVGMGKDIWMTLDAYSNYQGDLNFISKLEDNSVYEYGLYHMVDRLKELDNAALLPSGIDLYYLKNGAEICAFCPGSNYGFDKPHSSKYEDALKGVDGQVVDEFATQTIVTVDKPICELNDIFDPTGTSYLVEVGGGPIYLGSEEDSVMAWFKPEEVKNKNWVTDPEACSMFYYTYSQEDLVKLKVNAGYKKIV